MAHADQKFPDQRALRVVSGLPRHEHIFDVCPYLSLICPAFHQIDSTVRHVVFGNPEGKKRVVFAQTVAYHAPLGTMSNEQGSQ